MPLPPKMNKFATASPVIVSYDFTDFASGVAFQTFFLAEGETSGGFTQFLVEVPRAQSAGAHQVSTGAPKDFDLSPFDGSRVISGTATFGGFIPTTGDTVTVQIKKWDGSSETNVSSAIISQLTAAGEDVYFQVPCTETVFNVGDVLRVSITVTGTNGDFNIDPLGLTGAPSRIDIPFKTQL